MLKRILPLFATTLLFSCSNKQETKTTDPLVDNLDTTIKPVVDMVLSVILIIIYKFRLTQKQ